MEERKRLAGYDSTVFVGLLLISSIYDLISLYEHTTILLYAQGFKRAGVVNCSFKPFAVLQRDGAQTTQKGGSPSWQRNEDPRDQAQS